MVRYFRRYQAAIGMLVFAVLAAGLPQATTACDASKVEAQKGKVFSKELSEEARRASGARYVRAVGPGIVSSADRLPGRLNVEVDHAGVIRGFWCE